MIATLWLVSKKAFHSPGGVSTRQDNSHRCRLLRHLTPLVSSVTLPTCRSAHLQDMFTEVFRALPLAVVIDRKVLVLHGGLFEQDGVKLEALARIDRFREPGDNDLMSQALWSDPSPVPGRGPSKRGVGSTFGPDVSARFLDDNGLELLIRSHEVQDEGATVMHNGRVITVFSAPNYW